MSLVAELQRRSVFKVGIAYLVVAWLVIQVAVNVLPQFETPAWFLRAFMFVVALGFPLALVIAWAVELTPEGMRLEPAPVGNKRMYVIAAVLAALAVGWFLGAGIGGGTRRDAGDASPAAAAGGASARAARLAVLPLANFSPDPNNAFFADGLHDDMLTALSRLQGVDVISRTTMQTFRGSPLTLSEIAAKLGATHVLEGSVRRDALKVRLTVQLIDANTDDHLWAETYDRPLDDALGLQATVAKAVAEVLKVAVEGGAASEAPPTSVAAAYDLYLKARVTTNADDQLKLLDSALLLDSKFTLARAERASAAGLVLWFDGLRRAQLAAQARADIDQARAEQPDLPAVAVAEGSYTYRVLRDYGAALAILDRSLVSKPNDVSALVLRAATLRRLAREDEAIEAVRRALKLEPNNPVVFDIALELLTWYDHPREALALIDAAVAGGAPGVNVVGQRYRPINEFQLTGDLPAFLRAFESQRSQDEEANAAWWGLQAPSAARMKYFASSGEEWSRGSHSALAPTALAIAIDADAIGDTGARDAALAQAARLYEGLPADLLAEPETLAQHGTFLALRGESAAAVAEIERAIASTPPRKDAMVAVSVRQASVYGLARAGAKDRAIEVLQEGLGERPVDGVTLRGRNGAVFVLHYKLLHAVLGTDPRYQALMKQIESRFEKL